MIRTEMINNDENCNVSANTIPSALAEAKLQSSRTRGILIWSCLQIWRYHSTWSSVLLSSSRTWSDWASNCPVRKCPSEDKWQHPLHIFLFNSNCQFVCTRNIFSGSRSPFSFLQESTYFVEGIERAFFRSGVANIFTLCHSLLYY